jgi:nucleoside-diphosphate-sugar epimerase
MDLRTNQVLVTGAAGWLGGRLVDLLLHGVPDWPPLLSPERDLRVRCLVLPSDDCSRLEKLGDRVEIVSGDITKKDDCTRFCMDARGAVLFHTAGIIHPRRPWEFYSVNVHGTCNVIEAAIAAGLRRAVVISSNSPCGTNPHPDHVFDEDSPYRPYMHYGHSKMLMEQAIARYYNDKLIETAIIRAPWFYGPNQPPRQSQFFRMIRDGKGPIVGSGENRRSMAYVDNLCQGLILVAQCGNANGQVYWIADERPYTMNEILDTVERLLETEFGQTCVHRRLRLPSIASEVAYVMDGMLQRLGTYNQQIHVLSEMNKTIACSIEKAKSELGYQPTVALEEGMRRSLKWLWKHHGGLN